MTNPTIAAAPALAIANKPRRPSESIAERRSKELVIAFSGPVGCGIAAVREKLEENLSSSGYKTHHIKISDYLKTCLSEKIVNVSHQETSDRADRYIRLQEAGNMMREKQGDILAEYAIKKIAEIRAKDIDESRRVTDDLPERTAYIIDQLKHQDEVNLLRAVYGNLFYLFGVLSTAGRRASRLQSEGVGESRISELIARDRKQTEKHGQQLDKTLQLADFFIRNEHANASELESQVKRFIDLIHGVNGITPTREEYGMYAAYASGLRSACLSRQVGASIMNPSGQIIATGRNDVPKPTGGLYGPEDLDRDARCIKLEGGECHNDKHKMKLASDIEKVIEKELKNTLSQDPSEKDKKTDQKIDCTAIAKKISTAVYSETRLGGLIEFSRSIHAEMDAIISLALKGSGSTNDATLFTYTFPCHNCARHIVAAGIKRVYYLEPYEKSLATQLHGDAISVDGQPGGMSEGLQSNNRVEFIHFEGVAPRQYSNLFTPTGEIKDPASGKAIKINVRTADKKVPEYLDDYREYELKVVEHFEALLSDLKTA